MKCVCGYDCEYVKDRPMLYPRDTPFKELYVEVYMILIIIVRVIIWKLFMLVLNVEL
jgi:hypothetical protein